MSTLNSTRMLLPCLALALAAMPAQAATGAITKTNGTIKLSISGTVTTATTTETGTSIENTCTLVASTGTVGGLESITVPFTVAGGKFTCAPVLDYTFFTSGTTTVTIGYQVNLVGTKQGIRTSSETVDVIPLPANGTTTTLAAAPQF